MTRFNGLTAALILVAGTADAKLINGLEVDCTEKIVTGYKGVDLPYDLTVITIGGKPIQVDTARAYYQMYLAAKADGVNMVLVSAFRTMAQQKKLYDCHKGKTDDGCPPGCSSCAPAAFPGTSKHQKGNAVDVQTNKGKNATYKWLKGLGGYSAHGPLFGFQDTYNPPEPWHWAYVTPGNYVGPCDPGGESETSLVCTPAAVPGAEGSAFKDVLPTSTFATAIDAIAAVGITTGCQPDPPLFCPGCVTTRAQMVTFIVRALGVAVPTPAVSSFTDVPKAAWFFKYVEKAKELGITTGCTPTTFCPEDPVTREQAAKFIVEALGWPQVSPPTPSFTDIDKFKWSYPYIETLADYCVTTGCGPGLFCPADPLTREQAALMLARAFDLEDHNPCLQACDSAGCEGASYCEDFAPCGGFADACAETGSQVRKCWSYACDGDDKIATCVAEITTEVAACTRDTDGLVIQDWIDVGPCVELGRCSHEGRQGMARAVCADGVETHEVQTVPCPLSHRCPDPGEAADAGSIAPDVSTTDARPDTWTVLEPDPAPDVAAAESVVTSQSGRETGGCATARGAPRGGQLWLLLLCPLLVWRRRYSGESCT